MAPQMNKKQVVATLEINVNTFPGIKIFKMTASAITAADIKIAFAGTCVRESLPNFSPIWIYGYNLAKTTYARL